MAAVVGDRRPGGEGDPHHDLRNARRDGRSRRQPGVLALDDETLELLLRGNARLVLDLDE
jgi:hypothetical protein